MRIPWASNARLIEAGGAGAQVGTLRGCVRAWSFREAERQSVARIECADAVQLSNWEEAVVLVGSKRIAELLTRIGW